MMGLGNFKRTAREHRCMKGCGPISGGRTDKIKQIRLKDKGKETVHSDVLSDARSGSTVASKSSALLSTNVDTASSPSAEKSGLGSGVELRLKMAKQEGAERLRASV